MGENFGRWERVEIDGKVADVYEPLRANSSGQAVLYLHGHGLETLNGNAVFSAELERHGLYAICPHGERCWWSDLICDEFDASITPIRYLRESVVPYFASRWNVVPPGIGLLGISMGGQGAMQLAYRFPREFPVLAAISPAIDFHHWYGNALPIDGMFANQEAARQETVTLQLHPLNWPRHQWFCCDPLDSDWFEGADRLAMKLSSSGILFERDLVTSDGGHCWDYFERMASPALRFIVERLEQESRRL